VKNQLKIITALALASILLIAVFMLRRYYPIAETPIKIGITREKWQALLQGAQQ